MKTYLLTPIGWIELVEQDHALVRINLNVSPPEAGMPAVSSFLLDEAVRQFKTYFEGRLKSFDLPVRLNGTPFQEKVWRALCGIPYGETRSYGEIAAAIGQEKAPRAVGMANNRNPLSIVVPCHRVIGADGRLVGYGGGLPVKTFLLEHERKFR